MAEIEGKDSIYSKDDLSNAFAILLLDAINKDMPYNFGFDFETFFTLVKGFTIKLVILYAETFIDSLNN
jgi:hypothetical protein